MTQTIPTQETALQVQSKPPVITFDFEAAKAAVKASLEKYTGLVVSEDTTVEIKKDMADLNRQKAALADAAKKAVKGITDPLDKFSGEVKELLGLFEDTYKNLGGKVKFFEDKQREEKKSKVREVISDCFAEKFGTDSEKWPTFFAVPIQDKWLNKTTSLKSIHEDVLAIVQRHIDAEAQKKALEQAGKDRAAAIEAHVNGQNAMLGIKAPVSYYMANKNLSLETPLHEVLTGITEHMVGERARHEQQEAAKKPAPTPEQEQVQQEQPETQPVTEPVTEPQRTISWSAPAQAAPAPAKTDSVSMIVCLEYYPGNGKSIETLLAALERQCVSFSKRTPKQ